MKFFILTTIVFTLLFAGTLAFVLPVPIPILKGVDVNVAFGSRPVFEPIGRDFVNTNRMLIQEPFVQFRNQ